ncbi:MAG: toxin-antitoxin system YwqK family antitoxin [Archangium sp.]
MSLRFAVLTLFSFTAFAENAERGQRNVDEEVIPKINRLCGVTFTAKYDRESLAKHNKDIRYDQTDGANECDEPFRLLWLLCQTDAGKAVVRKNELREVVCMGTPNELGSLTIKKGVITVERAFEEPNPYIRAHDQFQTALKVKVPVKQRDPYYDQEWRDYRHAPAPVTSTTDYCLVNGEKKKLDLQEAESRRDSTVKCFQKGLLVIDLTIKGGKKNGLSRSARGDEWYRTERYVDGKREGISEQYEKNKLSRQEQFTFGERVWSKEFSDDGKLKDYFRQYSKGQVTLRFSEEGKVTSLNCLPEARGDEVVAEWCGFKGEKTVQLYDGTRKVSAIRTFKDGVMTREEPGDSAYASRRSVRFDGNGKKQGEEKLTREDGTLESIIRWKAGVQDGDEERYSKDGKKVVTRLTWKDGVQKDRTEFFLNGNPKNKEVTDGDSMTRTSWFDVGPKQSESQFKKCQRYGGWCEEGLSRAWYENGKPADEARYVAGQPDGVVKHWYPNGQLESEERWEKGTRRSRKQWDDKGAVTADDEFEEDGSRKLKR